MNAYRRALTPSALVEAWAGGPCVVTGKFCPVWNVRRIDGTGEQSRGASRFETMDEAARVGLAVGIGL